jgi:hypothetical protein
MYWKERGEQMREMLGLLEGEPEANVLVAGGAGKVVGSALCVRAGLCTMVRDGGVGVAVSGGSCPARLRKLAHLLCLLVICTPPPLPTGDMNWIPIDSQKHALPLPAGWVDVWPALRQDSVGWTFDSARCYQKGRKYGSGVSIWQKGVLLAE